MCELTEAFFWI